MYKATSIKYLGVDLDQEPSYKTHILITTHLDNSNGLFYKELKKLQRVQYAAAKLVLPKGKYDSPTSCQKDLHWLPVKLRVQFKIILTVHKYFLGNTPSYLINKLKVKWMHIKPD